jgi:hypothetical protein
MDVTDLMRQCNGKASPSKALIKVRRRSWTSTSIPEPSCEEDRKDLGSPLRWLPADSVRNLTPRVALLPSYWSRRVDLSRNGT